jgi:hypothetical protein
MMFVVIICDRYILYHSYYVLCLTNMLSEAFTVLGTAKNTHLDTCGFSQTRYYDFKLLLLNDTCVAEK